MKGYTTLIGNGILLLAFLLDFAGVQVTEADQTAILEAITIIFNIVNRFRTSTPVGESK